MATCLLALVCLQSACRTPPAPAPVDLADPAWSLRRGQAVWCPRKDERPIAGELLLGERPGGDHWIEFSKPPLTLVEARITPEQWEVRWAMSGRSRRASGSPPPRCAWLVLGTALGGSPPPPWTFDQHSDGSWRLAHPGTGEWLAGYLEP